MIKQRKYAALTHHSDIYLHLCETATMSCIVLAYMAVNCLSFFSQAKQFVLEVINSSKNFTTFTGVIKRVQGSFF